MANFFNRFPQARLWLATLSAVGFTLGSAPLGYAQDIPTPTPPADGGAFDGAPDPTPSPEVTPEPSISPVEPSTSLPETGSPQIDSPVPTDIPAGDIPTGDIPAGDVPTGDIVEPSGDPLDEDPSNIDIPSPEELPGDVGRDQAAPVTESGGPVESPTTDAPVIDESPAAGSAPANNSPRGLW